MTTTAHSFTQQVTLLHPQGQKIREFTLIPNIEKVGAQRILRFMFGVLLPLLVTHILFTERFELSPGQYALAQLPVLIILFNLYYFLIRRMKSPQSIQLRVELDELCLSLGEHSLHRQKLADLHFQQLGWGMESCDLLPAIRIKGQNFPSITIGATSAPSPWSNIRQAVEFTDYWLKPGDSWEELKSILQL